MYVFECVYIMCVLHIGYIRIYSITNGVDEFIAQTEVVVQSHEGDSL